MINILYTTALNDGSGYSEAARNYCMSLAKHPCVNLSISSASFEQWKTDQSAYTNFLKPFINKPLKPDVQIIHMTPENFPKYKRQGIPNFGFFAWETDKLPDNWIPICNSMDGLLVPSDYNVEVAKISGITVPIRKVEHAIDQSQFEKIQHFDFGLPKDVFIFYSIFQWTERKNPIGLLKAYFSEFCSADKVLLLLKSYRFNNGNLEDKKWIEKEVATIGNSMNIKDFPAASLVFKSMSRQEMLSFHNQCDVLVHPCRSEGFGLTQFEAMAMGKPVISTNYSGHLEFMNKENSYLVDYSMTPVTNMPWNIYTGRQNWAEPDVGDLKKAMREVYENRDAAKQKGLLGKETVKDYSWKLIGEKMVKKVNEILEEVKK